MPHLANELRALPARDGFEELLANTIRLAAGLGRATGARVYLAADSALEPRAAWAASPDAAGDEEEAGTVAAEVLRLGRPIARERPSPNARPIRPRPPAAYLGVPLPDATGEGIVGALVLNDLPGREWREAEIADVAELATMGMARLQGVAPPRMPPKRTEGRRASAAHRGSSNPAPAELFSEAADAALVEIIRHSIVGNLHLGALKPGDRLPSIRQTARAFAVTPYMVLQAYAELEVEGLVERRERSGVFVADFESSPDTELPEAGAWMTEVLTQACQHQVKIPLLPDLIRRWTAAVRVRCACVESCVDTRVALAIDLSQQFGIDAVPVPSQISSRELRDVDLVITTAYHAAEVGPIAAELRKPILIATVSPLILSSALGHLREKELTVVCVDPSYGDRLRALEGGAYRDRVRVVSVDDSAALAALDRSEAVLMTSAARQKLENPDFRLVAPLHPSYSIDFAHKVAQALVRFNLQGARA